ncbi:MAG: hypothetical protein ABL998_13500 [Planctomycetota bacterium]
MRTLIPALYALVGCAALTWLDSVCFFFVFPRLLVVLFLLPLVPRKRASLGNPWATVPFALAAFWMLVLPYMSTGLTKGFFLAAGGIESGMTAAEVRARMDPYLEVPREYDWPVEEAWAWPAPGPDLLVFLSSLESGQTCEVFLDGDRVTRVVAEYVD